MIIFIILTIVLTALALAFILMPLLQHHDSVQASDVVKSGQWAAPVLAIAVPLLAISVYLLTGNYQAIALSNSKASMNVNESTSMEVLVEQLAQRMRSNPDDLQGWLMLGHSALVLGQEQRAKDAYAQALRLEPKNPEVLLDYANALTEITQSFVGKPYELIATALIIEPSHPRALWLMGLAEFENAAYAKSLVHWSQLKKQLPPQGKEIAALEKLIMEAQQRVKLTPELQNAPR